jgi:hypothetical protein
MDKFLNKYFLKIVGTVIMGLCIAHAFGALTFPSPGILSKPIEVLYAFITGLGLFAIPLGTIVSWFKKVFGIFLKNKGGAGTLLLFLTASMSLQSCKTSPPIVSEKHTHKDSVIVKEKLVPVPIPGSNVQLTQKQIDSIALMLAKYNPGAKIVYVKDHSGATQMKFWRDSITGELLQQCETIARNAEVKVTDTERYYRNEIEKIKAETEANKKKLHHVLGDKIDGIAWRIFWILVFLFISREVIKHNWGKIKSFIFGFK